MCAHLLHFLEILFSFCQYMHTALHEETSWVIPPLQGGEHTETLEEYQKSQEIKWHQPNALNQWFPTKMR